MSCLGVCAAGARADEVLLRRTEGLRDGLCAALRIQLAGAAEVRCEADEGGALAARLAAASRRTAQLGATLGVLLERDPDPRLVRMYLVSSRPEQALIALERIEDRADADADRSLALEVQSALVALASAPRPTTTAPAPSLASALAAPVGSRARWLVVAEASALLSAGALLRYGGSAALGARVAKERRFGELVFSGRSLSAAHERAQGAALDISEWGAALELRVGHTLRRIALGALLGVGAERVHARGRAPDGSTGGVRIGVARFSLGLDLRVRLARGAWLRLAPALELYPVQHRFAVDGDVLGALGRARLALPLGLIVALPSEREEADDAR